MQSCPFAWYLYFSKMESTTSSSLCLTQECKCSSFKLARGISPSTYLPKPHRGFQWAFWAKTHWDDSLRTWLPCKWCPPTQSFRHAEEPERLKEAHNTVGRISVICDIYDTKSSKGDLECRSIWEEPLCIFASMRRLMWWVSYLYFMFLGEKEVSPFDHFPTNQHTRYFGYFSDLRWLLVHLESISLHSCCGSIWVCACMQPRMRSEDKFKENAK